MFRDYDSKWFGLHNLIEKVYRFQGESDRVWECLTVIFNDTDLLLVLFSSLSSDNTFKKS